MSYQVRNARRAQTHTSATPRWQIDRETERAPCLSDRAEPFSTLNALLAYGEVNNQQIEYCSHYGEPGYSDPEKAILFANWNVIPTSFTKRLEAQGYEMEWSDEWYIDYNHDKAYRTSPNSYGWQCRLMLTADGGDYLTPDDSVSEWVAACENDTNRALPAWISDADIEAEGWAKQSDVYEHGFHPGQTDNPADIAAKLDGADYLFQITDVGQFDVRFQVWVKDEAQS
jgi:hypothetical protein